MPTAARMQVVAECREALARSSAVFMVEYRGMTVKKMTAIRVLVRRAGGEMKVAKNTLFSIAMQEEGLTPPENIMTGANAYTLVYGDVAAVAKTLRDFSKEKGTSGRYMKCGASSSTPFAKAAEAVSQPAFLPINSHIVTVG